MSTDKPSKNEDEYFAREDAERIRKLREQGAAERAAAERRSHHMRCPKCGGTLHSEEVRGIVIERCPDCHGIWLDHGEMDLLMKHEEHGILRRVLGDVWQSIHRLKAGS